MFKLKRTLSLVLTVIMLFGCISVCLPISADDTATIVFDTNGGAGGPDPITVNKGTVITVPEKRPVKAGMVFRGWAFSKEKADAGDITYTVDTAHQILVNSSATLYASWAYSVVLKPGTQGWGTSEVQLYKFPSVDLQLHHHKSDIQANYGFNPGASGDLANLMVFVEWNTNQMPIGKGNGTSYHESYTANAPTTLYCVWGNPVIYSAEGGRFPVTGTDTQEQFVVNYNSSVTDTNKFGHFDLPSGENAPYKAGCRLYTDDNGNALYARLFTDGSIYRYEGPESGLEIPIFNNSGYSWSAFDTAVTSYGETGMRFHAIWEPSVTYKANGGVGEEVVEYMTFAGGNLYNFEDYTVLANSFTNGSAAFKGWNTMPDGSGTSYNQGSVITDYSSNDPLILYAQWSNAASADKEYTVAFNAMEGYLETDKQSYTVAYGEKLSDAIPQLPIPVRVGYTFVGWFNEETGAELIYDNEYYSFTDDIAYTARWQFHGHHVLSVFKKEATCQAEGYFTQICKACDYKSTITYEKTLHTYGSWTDLSDGSIVRFCNNCYASETTDSTPQVQQEVIAYVNKNGGYVASDFAYVDTINYLGAAVDNGAGNYPFADAYFAEAPYMRQVASAHNPNVKIVLTIFNRNIVHFESWLQTETTRAQFANHLVGVVTANGFDGLDIDFEFPQDLSLRDEFALLLYEIRIRFSLLEAETGKHYILSIATPAASWAAEKYDLYACSQYLDYFNIMNYDLYCGTAVPYTHHHTPPYDNIDPSGRVPTGGSVQGDINLYKSFGIPASKIVSGSGMYSRLWTGVSRNNNGLFQPGTLDESNIHYDMLVLNYINKNGYVRYWDDVSKAPYLYNASNYTFLSYEDPESLAYKFEIIEREGVRGLMVFDYVTCDGAGIFPYIRANMGTVNHTCTPGRVESQNLTCGESGYITTYCAICDCQMSYERIYNEGHYCIDWEVTTPATQSSYGLLSGACLFCGETITREVEPLGYKVSFDPGNGTMTGSTAFIVDAGQRFGDVVGNPVPTLEDVPFVGWYNEKYDYVFDADDLFTFDGDMEFTAVWESEGDHLHRYSASVTKEATCTEVGIITYTCWCGDSYTEEIDALGHSYSSVMTTMPACETEGVTTYTCEVCSDSYTEPVEPLGHAWRAWEVIAEATETEDGLQQRSCRRGCGVVETQIIPAWGVKAPSVAYVENYTVTLEGILDVKEIRFAPGHYTTGAEVKAADGNLTLSSSLIAENTDEDGVFIYELAKMGEYTFWVRMNDGTSHFLYADTSEINSYLTAYGVKLTVNDFRDDCKDIWIGEGEWTSYRELKNNAPFQMQISSAKLATKFYDHDYTYTCLRPGVHTVLYRYNDGTTELKYIDLKVDIPEFEENNLQVTVSNIPDIKIIRVAPGQWSSTAEIKAASGVRNFSNKTAIKDADSYTVQFREEGWVTFVVEYNNGYQHIHQYYVEPKTPTMVQDGNTVTFSGLDDLNMVRYAPGKYTTANGIKNASGVKTLKSDAIDADGNIVISDLTKGSWTFMVQYTDESVSFFHIDVE